MEWAYVQTHEPLVDGLFGSCWK